MLRGTVLIALLLLPGCQQLDDVLGGMEKPAVRVAHVALSDLSLEAVTLAIDLEVSNPYSVPLPLLGVDYALASRSTQFLSGEGTQGQTIPAGGKGIYPVVTRIPFLDLLSVLSTVKPGAVVPYDASLGLAVDAPAIGRLRIPVNHSDEFPVPAVPKVSVGEIKWDELSARRVAASIALDIRNTNGVPLDLQELTYGLSLCGVKVGQAGAKHATSFAAGGEQRLTVPLAFSPIEAGMGLFNLLTGKGGSYEIAGTIKAGTPFGAVDLPYASKGETTFRK
jgi:LEA14-like dessication related protein